MFRDKYVNYPNEMTRIEIEKLILELLDEYFCDKISKNDFLYNACSLVKRDVLSYELLDNKVRNMLGCALFQMWDLANIQKTKNVDEIDGFLYIIINFGLQKCYANIWYDVLNFKNLDEAIFTYIKEIYARNGNDISNPYANIGRFK